MPESLALTHDVLRLNDGRAMPRLGLGVWRTPADATAATVRAAIETGYRSIDTAAGYANEDGVGAGVRQAGVPRGEVFITTKLGNDQHGYDQALRAFDMSLQRLGMDYVDLYLIHWPIPAKDLYAGTWRALVRLREEGRAKSIGVSNFTGEHLTRIIGETGVAPAVNQVELHPRFQQQALRAFNAERGIATECWSPLGQGRMLDDPVITAIAAKHGRTPAQAVLRWHLDLGLIVIPKSVTPSRIRENFEVADFRLDEADLAAIATLDDPQGRIGPDPDTFSPG